MQEGDGVVPEEAQRKNPNAIKFTSASAEVQLLHTHASFASSPLMH